MRLSLVVPIAFAGLLLAGPACAQDAPAPPEARPGAATVTEAPEATEGSGFSRFFKDVGGDYVHFFRTETLAWYATGAAAANMVYIFDDEFAEELSEPTAFTEQALKGGSAYGNLTLQIPLAVGWWVTGHAKGSAKAAAAGRDLLRAQINATTWAYALKYMVDRTRPNGDPRSFPSGHATATFATAMVLQGHYGWKVGVPFFGLAGYTPLSRLTDNKHWTSDVTMGAFVGMASARTVTLRLRDSRFALGPYVVPGGWGIGLTSLNGF